MGREMGRETGREGKRERESHKSGKTFGNINQSTLLKLFLTLKSNIHKS